VKRAEFERLAAEHLLPRLPGFKLGNGMLYAHPVGDLLRGVVHQASGYDRLAFYVSSFVMPLFVPLEDIAGGQSVRSRRWILGRDSPTAIADQVLDEGLPLLQRIRTVDDLIAAEAEAAIDHPPDALALETLGYAFALAGRTADAIARLQEAQADAREGLREDEEAGEEPRDWLVEALGRMQTVERALERGGREAVAILRGWRLQTAENLRIAGDLDPDPDRGRARPEPVR
jgi:hypothetical protein